MSFGTISETFSGKSLECPDGFSGGGGDFSGNSVKGLSDFRGPAGNSGFLPG
jgi:hypothetical protein